MDEELRRKVQQHEKDLYYGNGKPGLTTRVFLAEERIDAVDDKVETIIKDGKATRKMMLGVILTIIAEIIVKLVFKI